MELTPSQRVAIEIFTSEAGSFDIVCALAKEYIEKQRDTYVRNQVNLNADSNEQIGAKLKAFSEGSRFMDAFFREIGQFKKPSKQIEGKNPAR